MRIGRFLAVAAMCFVTSGCGKSSRAAATSTTTSIKADTSCTVGGVKVTLARYAVGKLGGPHVPSSKPGRQFLETEWIFRNGLGHGVALGEIATIAGRRTYGALSFGPVANIGFLRPGQEGNGTWWFEIPVHTQVVQIVYRSSDGSKGVWNLSVA